MAIVRALGGAGIEEPEADARRLITGILGIDGQVLIVSPDRLIGEAAAALGAAVQRRLKHEPVTRILGRTAFYGHEFRVTADVLDPRTDSEAVVDLALDIVRRRGLRESPITIADIGTGSGILIASLLLALPQARGVATDVSRRALDVAAGNAAALGLSDRLTFRETRGLNGCPGPFDLVVSNPPYIRRSVIAGLAPEVREFDPPVALDGGPDGLAIYREIAADFNALTCSFDFVTEIGFDQAIEVKEVFESAGGRFIDQRLDLSGHVRAVAFQIHP